MPVLKVLAADVERAFLTVIFDEVLMTTTDFMEEQEVFDLLKKKKRQSGVYEKNTDSQTRYLPTLPDTAEKL